MKPGDRVGRYILGEAIGEGAMAQVFASSHPVLERRVAIKVLKKEACHDPHYVARFLDDARSAHDLDHPNIVRVLDVDDSGEQPFIVMELVDGSSLDHWLPGRRLEVGEAVRIARDVARALDVAHRAGMVHRDVKPSNVLIDHQTAVVKLTDFGAAKRERPGAAQLTEMGQRIGTPRYMAPEQIDGRAVDARTDLFALGATLYELLANRPAFEGETVSAVFHAILFGESRPLAEVRPEASPELIQLVERLLAKAPETRPASASEVAAALDPFVTGAEPDQTHPAPAGPRPVATDRTVISGGGEPTTSTLTSGGGETTSTAIGGGEPTTSTAIRDGEPKTSPVIGGGEPPVFSGAGLRARAAGVMRFILQHRPQNRLVPALLGGALALLVVVVVGTWWLMSPGTGPEPAGPELVTLEPVVAGPPKPVAPGVATPARPEPDTAQGEPKTGPSAAPPQSEGETETAVSPGRPDEQAAEGAPESAVPPARQPEPSEATGPPRPETGAEQNAGPDSTTAPAPEPPTTTAGLTPGEIPATPAPPPPELLTTVECPADTAAAPGCALAAEALLALKTPVSEAPTLTLNRPNGIYLDHDYLVIETQLPPDVGGYLYLDVLTDAGSVYHMLPEPMREDNQVAAGGKIRVGIEAAEQREGVRFWEVGEPFGEGYVLVLVSEKPIYEGLRPIEETIADYQNVLLGALADPSTGKKLAQVERLEFRPRGG